MTTIPLPRDFSEFLKLLAEHEVRYLLVGGYAVAHHGYVRGTADMDLWVDQAGDNPDRLVAAIREFGFSSADLTPDHFHKDAQIIRMGVPPLRIELMTSVSGVGFDECYDRREIVNWGGLPVSMISLDMLKQNKQAASRQKDLSDLDQLD